MAEKPEEYIREKGRRTTNPAEGFHGTCLAYRDKRIDLNCQRYHRTAYSTVSKKGSLQLGDH